MKRGSDLSREVLNFMKKGSDYSREVLKFVKIRSQKCWVYDNSQNKMVKSVRFLIATSLKCYVLRGSFIEKVRQPCTKSTFLKALRCGTGTGGI